MKEEVLCRRVRRLILYVFTIVAAMLLFSETRCMAKEEDAREGLGLCRVEYRFAPACYNARGETICLENAEPLKLPDTEEYPSGASLCRKENYGQGAGWEAVCFRLDEGGRRIGEISFPMRLVQDEQIEIAFFTMLSYSAGGVRGLDLPEEQRVEFGRPLGADKLRWMTCSGYKFSGWYMDKRIPLRESSLILEANPVLRAGWRTEAWFDLSGSLDQEDYELICPRWRWDESLTPQRRFLLDAFIPGSLKGERMKVEVSPDYIFLGFSTALHGRPVSDSFILEKPDSRFYAQYVNRKDAVHVRLGPGEHGMVCDTNALELMIDGRRSLGELCSLLKASLKEETADSSGAYVLIGFMSPRGEVLNEKSGGTVLSEADENCELYLKGVYEKKTLRDAPSSAV